MQGKTPMLRRLVVIGALAGLLAGCTAQYRNHGYLPPEEDLQQIVPGVDTRATVEEVVGVPGTTGILDASGYYYVGTTMRHFGARAPEVVDREVVAISFAQDGVVTNIERYGLEDGRVVPISRRVTEATGRTSFLRRIFGNIGGLATDAFFPGGGAQ